MDDFKKSEVGTFEEELQALIDYGHECCARIDDKIHEQCLRIKKAHGVEVGGYATALGWKQEQDQLATTYDVLGNERHKAVCELQRLRFIDESTDFSGMVPPKIRIGDVCNLIGAFSKLQDDWPSTLATARDTLIYLLGGDANGMGTAGRGVCDCASADVPTAGRVDGSGDRADNQGQVLTPITQELRDSAERYCNFKDENIVKFTEGEFDRLCDAIDAVHANLERENAELRQRTMYPAESERVNMLEREVKRLAAECKTQRNNFDQATSAREHWKNLYEQALEHTHDLERDYEVACHVNEKQEREYIEWCDATRRMQKEIDDLKEHHEWAPESHYMMLPKDSDGVPVRIGDVMEWPDTTTAEVVGVGNGTFFYVEVGENVVEWARTCDKIHHVQESVEDTLRDVVTLCHNTWKEGSAFEFYDVDDVMKSSNISEYAAKLRMAESEDA